MDYRYKLTGKVKGGKRIYDNPQLLQRHLMSLEGEDFEEVSRKKRLPVSAEQIKFLIGVVIKEAHRHDQFVHYESPKILFDKAIAPIFLKEYTVVEGKLKTRIKSLSELHKDEMWELTERVVAWLLTEHGIEIEDKEKYHIK